MTNQKTKIGSWVDVGGIKYLIVDDRDGLKGISAPGNKAMLIETYTPLPDCNGWEDSVKAEPGQVIFKEGCKYKTASGFVYGPMRKRVSYETHPWECTVTGHIFTNVGEFYIGMSSNKDLVEEFFDTWKPWTFETAPLMIKVKPRGSGSERYVMTLYDQRGYTRDGHGLMEFSRVFDRYEQLDGSPCGEPV